MTTNEAGHRCSSTFLEALEMTWIRTVLALALALLVVPTGITQGPPPLSIKVQGFAWDIDTNSAWNGKTVSINVWYHSADGVQHNATTTTGTSRLSGYYQGSMPVPGIDWTKEVRVQVNPDTAGWLFVSGGQSVETPGETLTTCDTLNVSTH